MTWKRDDKAIYETDDNGIQKWGAVVMSSGRASHAEMVGVATLMVAAPALKSMVERLVSECRGHGFGQLVMDAELLLKELDHGE